MATPLTIRRLNHLGDHILKALPDDLDTDLAHGIQKFAYGARVQATQLVQIKDDLSRTKLAESARQVARAEKNRQLQHGGVMTVNEARRKIQKTRINEVAKAEGIIEAFREKQKKRWIKIAREAAKTGRSRLKR